MDFRKLVLWDEARCLTLAVHEQASAIPQSAEGNALAAEIQSVCVAILTKIIEAYDGTDPMTAAKSLVATDELLRRLDQFLQTAVASGLMPGPDTPLLREEVQRIRLLLTGRSAG